MFIPLTMFMGCEKKDKKEAPKVEKTIQDKLPKCLFVASYHRGFEFQDKVEKELRSVLNGKCEIKQFDMDTKRNPAPEFCRQKALEAKSLIESWKPDIVIVSDDNASKYLVKPYYKDAKLPIVFTGVNYSVKEYGYPYSNVTGMIEVHPIRQLIEQAHRIVPKAMTVVCLSPDRHTSHKQYKRFKPVFKSNDMDLIQIRIPKMADFEKLYIEAQKSDYVLFDSNAGIDGWDETQAKQIIMKHTKKLTLSAAPFMVPYVMLALTHVPEELGEYAAKVALDILDGRKPADIPIISNQKWDSYVNESLLKLVPGIKIPSDLFQKYKKAG